MTPQEQALQTNATKLATLPFEGCVKHTMNITDEIRDFAGKCKLEEMATGGGMDYIVRHFDTGVCFVLGIPEDGGSPDTLSEKSTVSIYETDDWNRGFVLPFTTAREAMVFMGTKTPTFVCVS